jgi:hypothetical protein
VEVMTVDSAQGEHHFQSFSFSLSRNEPVRTGEILNGLLLYWCPDRS